MWTVLNILQMVLLNKLTQYLELIRARAFTTFIQMVAGFFIVAHTIDFKAATLLAWYFIVLGPFLYGGLYILNNIVDYPQDKHGKTKQKRPLISGEISLKTAWSLLSLHLLAVMAALVISGFPPLLCTLALTFIAINLFYTLVAKRIPYLDFVACSLGHPARIAAGILLAGGRLLELAPLLTISLLTTTALNILKRLKERELDGAASRPVLKFYPRGTLLILAAVLILLSVVILPLARENMWELIFAAALILGTIGPYAVYLFGGGELRNILLKVWR